MRTLALASMMLGAALSSSAFAQDSNQLNYNIVNIQADASRQVANDQMQAVLYIEKSHKQPAELSNQINQLMNQAQALSRKYPQVKVNAKPAPFPLPSRRRWPKPLWYPPPEAS